MTEIEAARSERNKLSGEVAQAKRKGEACEDKMEGSRRLGEKISAGEKEISSIEPSLDEALLLLPNPPDPSIPDGDASANRVEKTVGEAKDPPGGAVPHWETAEKLGICDFERAVKISGARFYCLIGAGAALERALVSFMLDRHTRNHGYTEVFPPFLVNNASMTGTGQYPKFQEEYFVCERDGLSLIPTAEVPVTNLYRDEILPAEKLPVAHCAYTACFRREAGAAGRETRGVLRVHQFNKVELVRFVRPEKSHAELELLTGHAEAILEALGLAYRRVTLAAGDLGFSSSKTYDLEVWMPGQKRFVEISSCSNFCDFQARRMKIRLRRDAKTKPEILHTLNGSGLAVGRTWAAVLENFLEADGSVRVPEVLRTYLGGLERISR